MITKKRIATFCLMTAMFLNPLGFDVAVASIMELTGSYWWTMAIFYVASAFCFGLYFWLSGVSFRKTFQKMFGRTN